MEEKTLAAYLAVVISWHVPIRVQATCLGLSRWKYDQLRRDPQVVDDTAAEERARLIVEMDRRLSAVIREPTFRREWLYHTRVPRMGVTYMDAMRGEDVASVRAAHEILLGLTETQVRAGIYW